jgi:hypothetical protein
MHMDTNISICYCYSFTHLGYMLIFLNKQNQPLLTA